MVNKRSIGKWLVHAIVGYLIAVTVATIVAIAVLAIQDGWPSGRPITRMTRELWQLFLIGFALTGMMAAPGYLATIAFSTWRNIKSKSYFAVCGVLTAILAVAILDGPGRLPNNIEELYFTLPAGLIGGLAYAFWRSWLYDRA